MTNTKEHSMKTIEVEEILPPKMIISAYKTPIIEINDILKEMLSCSDFMSIDFYNSIMQISTIIKRYRIPYNIYASGIDGLSTVLCTLVKWSMDNPENDENYHLKLVNSSMHWLALLHLGVYKKQTPDDFPDYKMMRKILNSEDFSSIEKLLIITKAVSYFNPAEPNPELWPNDPKVLNIITAPPGDRALELLHQLMEAPNNRETISLIADELIVIYKESLQEELKDSVI